MATRPELEAPPDVFYNEEEAKKYGHNSRMLEIQTRMAERAVELLAVPKGRPAYILDIGTGSGLSGEVLTEAGYEWLGFDISKHMLGVALRREVEGDLLCMDMGQGMVFRPSTFDGCISISALQWLCNADQQNHRPMQRLKRFFVSLYHVLARGSRAVFQFYPQNADQLQMINKAVQFAGFTGGLVIDYPNSTKAKKHYLVLFAASLQPGQVPALPKALEGEEGAYGGRGGMDDDEDGEEESKDDWDDDDEGYDGEVLAPVDGPRTISSGAYTGGPRRLERRRHRGKPVETRKAWIARKKDRQRRQGKEVGHDSKYSGRSRGPKF